MWHGTRNYDARLIANSDDGFSTQHASDGGFWGRAVYFAVNSSYSCGVVGNNGYSHPLPNGATLSDGSTVPNGTYLVVFAKVQVGKEFVCQPDSSLREPP